MTKINWKSLFTYLTLFLCLIVLRQSEYSLAFCFGLFVGGLYCLNPFLTTLTFALSSIPFGLSEIIVTLTQGGVMLLIVLIYKITNKKIHKGVLICYVLIANVFYVLYELNSTQELFNRCLNVGIGAIFAFVSIYVVRALFVRGLKYRLAIDEQICLAVMVIALAIVLTQYYVFGVHLIEILIPIALLVSLFVYGGTACFCTAGVFGISSVIALGTLTDLSVFTLWALAAVAFCKVSRWLSTLAVMLAELVAMYFFSAYGAFDALILLPCVVGCGIFCCLPTKMLEKLSDLLGGAKEQYSSRFIINRLRSNLSKKLFELSEIFFQMQLTFKSMVKGVLPPDKAVVAISREVCDKVCRDCSERTKCWRNNLEQTEHDFCEITMSAMDRGKATLLDLPSAMASKCQRINAVLSTINSEVTIYKQYYFTNNSSDNSRLLIGEQLNGVSQIMMQLSQQCKGTLIFEKEKEKIILEELTFCNVLTKEVVIWEEQGVINVTLTVGLADASKDVLLQVVSKNVNCNMMIDAVERMTDNDNWVILHLKQKPSFNVAFGLSANVKHGSEISGDTHSFIKINKDKLLIALCDGMGSGEQAERTSNVAISLVENFYKAGFDNDIILSSVNRLLSTANEEAFTAVDICVINLNRGLTDFIKLGTPSSVVRCNGEVQFVAGGSLPLGVLEEMKPVSTKKALSTGDMVALYSDGFYDCFEDKNEIAELIDKTALTNPQLVADEMMKVAMEKCSNLPNDDMTVIVARITPA